ncbi:MAG: SRPBCC family protein [bacterium]|nr:SRPBCC family protein [bacterium]
MQRQFIITEIAVPQARAWELLTDPKEFSFWAHNVRDLEMDPPDAFGENSIRRLRLNVTDKIETLDMRIVQCTPGESFTESPIGGSMRLHEKVEYMKLTYHLEAVDDKTCSLTFTLDYKMKGLLNQLLEKLIIGSFTTQLRLWFERLKTYAETGRPV